MTTSKFNELTKKQQETLTAIICDTDNGSSLSYSESDFGEIFLEETVEDSYYGLRTAFEFRDKIYCGIYKENKSANAHVVKSISGEKAVKNFEIMKAK